MPRSSGGAGAMAIVALLVASSLLFLGPTSLSVTPARGANADAPRTTTNVAAAALAAARASLAAGSGPAASAPDRCWASALRGVGTPGGCVVREFASASPPPAGPGGWRLLGVPPYFITGGLTYDAADGYVLEFGGLDLGNVTWTYLHGVWRNITSTAGPAPSARLFPSLAYDPALSQAVLFGGEYAGSQRPTGSISPVLRDTWTFGGGHWANVTSSSGTAPSARWQAGLAYDANDLALVLYGGTSATSAPQSGTWEFLNGTWKNVTANQTTSPVVGPLPAFAGDRTDGYAVWYGGGTASNPSGNATWEFAGNRWKNVTANVTSSGLDLPNLRLAELATESSPDGVILYGGVEAPAGSAPYATNYRGTWHYVAGAWNFVTGGGPAGAEDGMFADDPPDLGMVYYGGIDQFNVSIYADTYNFSGGTWHHVASPASPTPGVGPMMAYDSSSSSVVVFPGGDRNETWTYAGGTWTQQHPAQSPPVRIGGTLFDDPPTGGVVLFGGEYASTSTIPPVHYRNDTWLWVNGSWTNLTAIAQGPSPRVDPATAYDSTLGRAVLFGGLGLTRYDNDTWEFSSERWTNVTQGASPSGRDGVAFSDDPADHGLLAFGGFGSACSSTPHYCNDTWTFDNGTWTKQSPGVSPPVQDLSGLAYDPAFGGEVLIGGSGWVTVGSGGSQQALNSTWLYQGGRWSNLTASLGPRGPPAAAGPSVAYDAADGYLFLFDGGYNNIGLGDWWSLTPAGGGSPLSVGTPTATVNPVAANATTTLAVPVSGGAPPYEISWGGLPAGCSTANATTLSCTPTSATVAVVTVTATDSLGAARTGPGLTLTVTATGGSGPSLVGVTLSPAASTLGPNQSVVLAAQATDSGHHAIAGATYAWSIVSGDVGSFNQTSGPSVRFTAVSVSGTAEVKVVASYGGKTLAAWGNVTVTVACACGAVTAPKTTSTLEIEEIAAIGLAAAVVVGVVYAFVRSRRSPPSPPPP